MTMLTEMEFCGMQNCFAIELIIALAISIEDAISLPMLLPPA